jgi:hypothetical protein
MTFVEFLVRTGKECDKSYTRVLNKANTNAVWSNYLFRIWMLKPLVISNLAPQENSPTSNN